MSDDTNATNPAPPITVPQTPAEQQAQALIGLTCLARAGRYWLTAYDESSPDFPDDPNFTSEELAALAMLVTGLESSAATGAVAGSVSASTEIGPLVDDPRITDAELGAAMRRWAKGHAP